MKRITYIFRMTLALGVAALGVGLAPWAESGSPAAATSSGGGETPLPDGWELCILQGLSAPANQANVTDLDEWQVAEGGSTNNTAAYNPFNTARTTDLNNNPLPEIISANGFPAFGDWISGCAATVATILQPNMSAIAAGLRAGNVSPPAAFLAVVDQSQWCAPSADGTPCYSDTILGTTGSLAAAVLAQSPALQVFSNVRSDLRSYQLAVVAVALAQQNESMTNAQLSAAESALSVAQGKAAAAENALRHFAIEEYVDSGLYQSSFVASGRTNSPFGTLSPQGVDANQYARIVGGDLLTHAKAASDAAKASRDQRDAAQKALQQAVAASTSDNATESKSLVRLVADVTTLQKAGACTNATLTSSTPTTPAPSGAVGTTTTTTTTTTTPSSAPTTSVPTTSTTTTTAVPAAKLPTVEPTTTTSVPTTSTTISSSATTTTIPGNPSDTSGAQTTAPPQSANPAGLSALQGCVTVLAPPTGA
ncbi:MAG TPA: hypothetical protein VG244_11680 [Acidimicrobiales bacterium]|jgi:hypothetical protein|nr:hypothetical protein [Acidimicrobiales bacterium]